MCITKTLSLIVNGVLCASGAALFIVAIVMQEVSLQYLSTEMVDFTWIVTLLTIAGIMAAAAAISGLVGACCCEIKYLLFLSFGLIVAVFIMETVFVINSSVATIDDFNSFVDNEAKGRLNQYYKTPAAKEEWDNFQTYGECCGFSSYNDWQTMEGIPTTCCRKEGCDTTQTANIYREGCRFILKDKFKQTMDILRGATYGIMFVHAGAGVFSVFMMVKAALCGCLCCCL